MAKQPEEWFKQAAYDLKTAEIMFENKRYIYVVFMCHLAIEKALKGIYQSVLKEPPPKVHNLIYLIERIGLHLPGDLYDAVFDLNRVSVPTRYPDDLRRLTQTYRKGNTRSIVEKSKEVLKWLRARP